MNASDAIAQISVRAFAERAAEVAVEGAATVSQQTLQLIDVREPQEEAIASLPGFTLFPLSQSEQWMAPLLEQLDPHGETYVLCHHGMRSAQMCQWLMSQGFTAVNNIQGGIEAYAIEVDPSVPRY
jgi:rhodanese-related sulfurtransferase